MQVGTQNKNNTVENDTRSTFITKLWEAGSKR